MHPVLIAGVHRSGTSWVARTLHEAGMNLGDDLLGDQPGNPYGHFEDNRVVALHDAALEEQDLTWKSTTPVQHRSESDLRVGIDAIVRERSNTATPWAIKDPRLCLFLPEWLAVAPQSRLIVVFRRPDEVVESLRRRHARRWVHTRHVDPSDLAFWEQPDLGLHLWVHYNEQLLISARSMDPGHVHVIEWNTTGATSRLVSSIAEKWNLELTPTTISLDPTLGKRSTRPLEVHDPRLITRAEAAWAGLQELRSDP